MIHRMHTMKKIIPEQRKGGLSATTYSVKARDVIAANALFKKGRKNLLKVNQWQQVAGPSTANFQVISNEGLERNGEVKEGNYLRISLPAVPGSSNGDG